MLKHDDVGIFSEDWHALWEFTICFTCPVLYWLFWFDLIPLFINNIVLAGIWLFSRSHALVQVICGSGTALRKRLAITFLTGNARPIGWKVIFRLVAGGIIWGDRWRTFSLVAGAFESTVEIQSFLPAECCAGFLLLLC